MSDTRWEQILRYRFIEIIALWEGRLTTTHLCKVFGIGRQQASKDINNYKRSIGPGNLDYDATAKGYKPSSTFSPKVTKGVTEEYLDILAGVSEMQQVLGQLPDAFTATEIGPVVCTCLIMSDSPIPIYDKSSLFFNRNFPSLFWYLQLPSF